MEIRHTYTYNREKQWVDLHNNDVMSIDTFMKMWFDYADKNKVKLSITITPGFFTIVIGEASE